MVRERSAELAGTASLTLRFVHIFAWDTLGLCSVILSPLPRFTNNRVRGYSLCISILVIMDLLD